MPRIQIPKEIEIARKGLKAKELSRVEFNSEGVCPICNEDMKLSEANGVPVLVCLKDRVTVPTLDGE